MLKFTSTHFMDLNSRTSPAPLTDLFQERALQKSKPIIQRVASMDSAKTVVQTHGIAETAVSELDMKTSDSNDKSGSGPLSLPLTVGLRTSPKKVAGGKSSSSGDTSFKPGKSSSSSSESKKKKTSSWYNVSLISIFMMVMLNMMVITFENDQQCLPTDQGVSNEVDIMFIFYL